MVTPERVNPREIGIRIRIRRRQLGMSQRVLATGVGVSAAFISGLEMGERLPSIESLARLSECLEQPMDELVLGNSPCAAERCSLAREMRRLLLRVDKEQ